MNSVKKCLLSAMAFACLVQAAYARRGDIRHEDVLIEKGQTMNGDVATDKSIVVNGVLKGDAVSVGGDSVTVNGEITGDVVSVGGAVYVPGLISGDLTSVGGLVGISGKVGGDVSSIGGSVELSGAGEVVGDISSLGGSVIKGAKSVHRGEVRNFDMRAVRTVLPRVLRITRYAAGHEGSPSPWLVGGLIGLGLIIFFSILITGAVLLVLPAVFFPKNVENAASVISGDMWRACAIGALMIVGFFPGLLMMIVSILGIPLVPFALMLYAIAGILGLSAFSVVLQGRFFEGIKKSGPAGMPGKVMAGYAIMAGLLVLGKLIPFIGGVLSLIGFMLLSFGTMLGLGAVLMTRMGNQGHVPVVRQPVP